MYRVVWGGGCGLFAAAKCLVTAAKYAGAVAAVLLLAAVEQEASAKTPGTTHCFNGICHRIRTVSETHARRGLVEPVLASFYDDPEFDPFNPRNETSSGELFRSDMPDNAASPIHPDGTILLVWSTLTGGAAIVRVNNAGPYYPGRTLDVSRGVANWLGIAQLGVVQLLTMVIAAPNETEARYRRGRTYPRVGGYLGRFESLALASMADAASRQALYRDGHQVPPLAMARRKEPVPQYPPLPERVKQAFGSRPSELIEPEFSAQPVLSARPSLAAVFSSVASELVAPNDAVLGSGLSEKRGRSDARSSRARLADPDAPRGLPVKEVGQPVATRRTKPSLSVSAGPTANVN